MPQEFQLLWRQVRGGCSIANSARGKVDLKRTDPDSGRRGLRRNRYSPECRAYTSQKLRSAKRLRDKVICSRIQSVDLIFLGVPDGKHDDRKARVRPDC